MRLPEVTDWVRDVPVRAFRTVFAGVGQLLLLADRARTEESDASHVQPAAEEHQDPHAIADSAAPAAGGHRRQAAKAAATGRTIGTDGAAKAAGTARAARAKAAKIDEADAGAETGKSDDTVTKQVKKPVRSKKTAKPAKSAGKRKGTSQPVEQSRWRSLDSTGNVRLLAPGEIAESKPEGASTLAAPQPAQVHEADEAQDAEQKVIPAPSDGLPLPGYDDLSLASLRARLRNLDADQLRTLIQYEKSNAGRADVITMFERRIAKLADQT